MAKTKGARDRGPRRGSPLWRLQRLVEHLYEVNGVAMPDLEPDWDSMRRIPRMSLKTEALIGIDEVKKLIQQCKQERHSS
jgi:hypothetical protein